MFYFWGSSQRVLSDVRLSIFQYAFLGAYIEVNASCYVKGIYAVNCPLREIFFLALDTREIDSPGKG